MSLKEYINDLLLYTIFVGLGLDLASATIEFHNKICSFVSFKNDFNYHVKKTKNDFN